MSYKCDLLSLISSAVIRMNNTDCSLLTCKERKLDVFYSGYNEYNISNSGSESIRSKHSNTSGVEMTDGASPPGPGLHPSETEPQLYRVLADYSALSDRELSMQEGEVVELIKVGCGGWWYVRVANYPDIEGWAPETYLERIPSRSV